MRDAVVIGLAQRADAKSAHLFKQFLFLSTRLQAVEKVMADLIPNAGDIKAKVDEAHSALWKEEEEKMRLAEERAKAEAAKPKITVVRP